MHPRCKEDVPSPVSTRGKTLRIHPAEAKKHRIEQLYPTRQNQLVAQKTLHKILSSPVRCDTVTLSSHLWTHNSGSSVVADFARPARRWCDLKDAVDSIPAEQSADQDSFANRKLIRPILNRTDHNKDGQ